MNKVIVQKEARDIRICWIGTILIAALLCYAQVRGQRLLLTGSLVGFLALALWVCSRNMVIPVLMFFLPWSTIMKMTGGGTSFFTLALLGACAFYCVKREFTVHPYQIFCPIAVGILSLAAKLIQNNDINISYLCFLMLLFLFPLITKNGDGPVDFWQVTLFFAVGIISAALTAQRFANAPNISQYIKVYAYRNITRLCGYYGDPNFYSAQISACLAGILTLLNYERKLLRQLLLAGIIIVLIYCGLLSGSKSFMLVTIILFALWATTLLERKRRGANKFQLVAGAVIVLGITLSSSAFGALLQILNERFAYRSDISSLTTGRSDVWIAYLEEFSRDPVLTLFGQGYSNVTLNGGKATHNTILQGIYQFGVLGFPWIIVWTVCLAKRLMQGVKNNWKTVKFICIMCVGIILPWMSIDILFFDELFLFPVYMVMGIKYSSEKEFPLGAGELDDTENGSAVL